MEPRRPQADTDRGGIAVTKLGSIGGGALAVAMLFGFAVRRRPSMIARGSAA